MGLWRGPAGIRDGSMTATSYLSHSERQFPRGPLGGAREARSASQVRRDRLLPDALGLRASSWFRGARGGAVREGKVCQGSQLWPGGHASLHSSFGLFPWLPAPQRTLADPRGGAAGSRRFAKAQVQIAGPWSLWSEIRQPLSPAGTSVPSESPP